MLRVIARCAHTAPNTNVLLILPCVGAEQLQLAERCCCEAITAINYYFDITLSIVDRPTHLALTLNSFVSLSPTWCLYDESKKRIGLEGTDVLPKSKVLR